MDANGEIVLNQRRFRSGLKSILRGLMVCAVEFHFVIGGHASQCPKGREGWQLFAHRSLQTIWS